MFCMSKFLASFIFIVFMFGTCHSNSSSVEWFNGEGGVIWAFSCGFKTEIFKKSNGRGEECGMECKNTAGCTHFMWNHYKGGTCWMMRGEISSDDAFIQKKSTVGDVCGIAFPAAGNGEETNKDDNDCVSQFRQATLSAHNEFRSRHGSGPLQETSELDEGAQSYAQYLAVNHLWEHSRAKNLGENLYMMSGGSLNCAQFGRNCAISWYNEVNEYDYSNPVYSMDTGHFTQLVWKSTTQVGFGLGIKGNKYYCVGQYYPSGNYQNRFQENVRPSNYEEFVLF